MRNPSPGQWVYRGRMEEWATIFDFLVPASDPSQLSYGAKELSIKSPVLP